MLSLVLANTRSGFCFFHDVKGTTHWSQSLPLFALSFLMIILRVYDSVENVAKHCCLLMLYKKEIRS